MPDPEDPEEKIKLKVTVWNPTVANLSLMALGSSAPELLLSIIETVTTLGQPPEELGPSTIVGSAAFNLMVISAVSIVSVDDPKRIDAMGVFIITAVSSVFAYVWMYLVLVVISKNQVDLWEAIVTFVFFFLLLIFSYYADKCNEKKKKELSDEQRKKKRMEELGLYYTVKDFYHILMAEKVDVI